LAPVTTMSFRVVFYFLALQQQQYLELYFTF